MISSDTKVQSKRQNMRLRILVVDDDESIRGLLESLLLEEGHKTTLADTAYKALDLIRSQEFDLVFTDIRMPGMTGIELLEKVKEIDVNIKVVIMTSYATVDYELQALKNSAFDFIDKPFESLDIVTDIVDRVISSVKVRSVVSNMETEYSKMLGLPNKKLDAKEAANQALKEKPNNLSKPIKAMQPADDKKETLKEIDEKNSLGDSTSETAATESAGPDPKEKNGIDTQYYDKRSINHITAAENSKISIQKREQRDLGYERAPEIISVDDSFQIASEVDSKIIQAMEFDEADLAEGKNSELKMLTGDPALQSGKGNEPVDDEWNFEKKNLRDECACC